MHVYAYIFSIYIYQEFINSCNYSTPCCFKDLCDVLNKGVIHRVKTYKHMHALEEGLVLD